MNLLDYALLAILGYCLVRGVFRGLIKELSSIIGVIGGFYAAFSYYPQLATLLAKHLSDWMPNSSYTSIISFLLIFGAVFLIISLAGVVIKYLVNIASLGWTDRISGALFGGFKGLLIISVILMALTSFLPKNADYVKKSWVAHHMMQYSALLAKVTPDEMKQLFGNKSKELQEAWQKRQ